MFSDIRPKCHLMLCKTAVVKVPFDVTYIFIIYWKEIFMSEIMALPFGL